MFFRNPKNAVKVLQYVAPAAAGAGTVNGAAVDATGYSAVLAVLLVGIIGADSTLAAKLQDGDDVATAATDRDEMAAKTPAQASDTQQKLGFNAAQGGKQVRVQLTRAGGNNTTAGWVLLGLNPQDAPVA
jgi:hypothetical protein